MRNRIRAACMERLIDAPESEVEHWLGLVRDLDAARISTIHSFCGSLLRAHAVEAGIDPCFRVLDQPQADTLLYELTDRELRRRLAEREEFVLDLVVQFGLGGLREMVRQLLARRQEIDWPQWRVETPAGLAARWETYWRNDTLPRAAQRIARLPAAATILRILRDSPPSHPLMRERAAVLLELLPALDKLARSGEEKGDSPHLCEAPSGRAPAEGWSRQMGTVPFFQRLAAIRENARVQGGGGKKAWPSDAVYEAFRTAAEQLREEVKEVESRAAFEPEAAHGVAETGLRLLAVADGVAAAYHEEKRLLAAMDFTDLLTAARDLLTGPQGDELRKRLAAQTRLLLVDEFQDTDPLQVALVKALCDGRFTDGKLFFVGDKKQSIYRFRGADPHVFRQLRQEIPAAGRLPLSLNFRSQPAVLEFVNALFAEEFGGTDNDAGEGYEPLRAFRTQVGPRPAVEFLWAVEPEEEAAGAGEDAAPEIPASERQRRLEADWIARRLRAMLDSGEKIVWEKPEDGQEAAARAVRPGDIALLFAP